MRHKRIVQQRLSYLEPIHHPVANALEAISAWLDAHPELLDAIAADLGAAARGLTCFSRARGRRCVYAGDRRLRLGLT